MKNIKKIAIIVGALLLSGVVVYATVTIAQDRKTPKLSWQGTPSGHYDSAHNVGDTYTAQSRFSFVSGTTKGNTGIVQDSVTGLMWESEGSNGDVSTDPWWQGSTTMVWGDATTSGSNAFKRCTHLTKGGYNNWRLPTIKELASIVDYTRYNPAVDTTYFELASVNYWSSTTNASGTSDAWGLYFGTGTDGYYAKTSYFYVLCVR